MLLCAFSTCSTWASLCCIVYCTFLWEQRSISHLAPTHRVGKWLLHRRFSRVGVDVINAQLYIPGTKHWSSSWWNCLRINGIQTPLIHFSLSKYILFQHSHCKYTSSTSRSHSVQFLHSASMLMRKTCKIHFRNNDYISEFLWTSNLLVCQCHRWLKVLAWRAKMNIVLLSM